MKSLCLLVAVAFCLSTGGAFGQSFGNITVTGTASVNEIDVSGPLEIIGNYASFGSQTGSSSMPGVSFNYSEANSGTNASFTQILTRPLASWNVQRTGSLVNAMQLTSTNQLVLTGTQSVNPGMIVMDPTAGLITVNGQQVLTSGSLFSVGNTYLSGGLGVGTSDSTPGTIQTSGNATIGGNLMAPTLSSGSGALEIQPGGQHTYFNGTNENGTGAVVQVTQNSNLVAGIGIAGTCAELRLNDNGPGIWGGDAGIVAQRNGVLDFFCGATGNGAQNVGRDTFTIANLATCVPNITVDQSETVYIGSNTFDDATTSLLIVKPQSNIVTISSKVGIGTATPQATLDVNGNAHFSGAIEMEPQGDLSMGAYTATPKVSAVKAAVATPAVGQDRE